MIDILFEGTNPSLIGVIIPFQVTKPKRPATNKWCLCHSDRWLKKRPFQEGYNIIMPCNLLD